MVDLGSLVLLMSIFGAKVAFAYVIVGLIIAVIGGTFIENLHMEKYVEDFVKNASRVDISSPALTKKGQSSICERTSDGNIQKSISIHFDRCGGLEQLFIIGYLKHGLKVF